MKEITFTLGFQMSKTRYWKENPITEPTEAMKRVAESVLKKTGQSSYKFNPSTQSIRIVKYGAKKINLCYSETVYLIHDGLMCKEHTDNYNRTTRTYYQF